MKNMALTFLFIATTVLSVGCGRHIRTAKDITPGNEHNPNRKMLDWRYGAADIRIQTTKLCRVLMDRWFEKTGYDYSTQEKPRIVITHIDNRTDQYISTDMIRDAFEGVAVNDGRFTITVGDRRDERELDQMMSKISQHPKYNNPTRLETGNATAPELLAKIRITKAINSAARYDIEDYRMTITLYDIETQELVDSAWDVLRKQVRI